MLTPGGEQVGFTVADRLDELAGIATLVLWGDEDHVICWRDALRIRVRHPQADIRIARGIGHMLPLEAPAWTSGHIRRSVTAWRRRALPKAA